MADIVVVRETAIAVLLRPRWAPPWDGEGETNEDPWAQWVPKKAFSSLSTTPPGVTIEPWFIEDSAQARKWLTLVRRGREEAAEAERSMVEKIAKADAWFSNYRMVEAEEPIATAIYPAMFKKLEQRVALLESTVMKLVAVLDGRYDDPRDAARCDLSIDLG